MRANNILETIGNTPLVRINRLFNKGEVWTKMEKANPAGSIKDRIALSMIEDAEDRGLLNENSVIIEPTSGNTGVGLAMVAAVKGYQLILVMPESMSIERRRLMSLFGARLELTPKEKGMPGAIARAKQLLEEMPDSWMPMQFDNESNTLVHYEKTAAEIAADFPEGFDYLITGVGTGGHITGVSRLLKQRFPNMKTFAVEPSTSAVISGGDPGPHPIQGIGAGFIPHILDVSLIDGVIKVEGAEAFEYTERAAKEEGMFVGISSGAAFAAVARKLPELEDDARILTFSYDTGERYLSVEGLFV